MHTRNFLVAAVLAALFQGTPTSAVAQANSNIERQKMHVVSRMYQATYGAQERCRPSKEASANLDKAVDQLRHAFPELLNLIDNSPYLLQAQEQFKTFLSNTAIKSSDEKLAPMCNWFEYMLRQLVESKDGQQVAIDMIQTLKK